MELTHLVVVLVPTSVFLSVKIGLRGILILIVKIFFIYPILLAHKLLVQFVLEFRILGLRVYVIDFLVVITLELNNEGNALLVYSLSFSSYVAGLGPSTK